MNKIYKIEGLDCPNCAKTLENEIKKLNCVEEARIDFLKGKLIIECEKEQVAIEEIKKLIKVVEPDAKIVENRNKRNSKLIIDLAVIIAGMIFGLCALFVPMSRVLFWISYTGAVIILGYKTFYKAIRLLIKGIINENLLITLSIVGAICLGEYLEGLMVILLYSIGKLLEGVAVNKSKKSIEEITKLAPNYSMVIRDGKEVKIDPNDISVGEIIVVKAGERVAVDGTIIDGTATLNLQSITGESLPVEASVGKEILSGAIVLDGVLKIQATKEFVNSTVSRIMHLIQNATDKKSKTETVISKISKWYTLGVLALAVSVFGLVWLITKDVGLASYRGLIFLLVSCPCAFAISVPLTYFSGLGNASRHGILIKGSNYLDACAKLNIVAFDKTGTLTTGEFEVVEILSVNKNYSEEDIVYFASLGEQFSNHPLSKVILRANTKELKIVTRFKEIAGKGISFDYNKKTYFIGRKNNDLKGTCVEVYENEINIGIIVLKDMIKKSSKEACVTLHQMGVKTILLSGDNFDTVKDVAEASSVGESKSNLLPEEKYKWILEEKANHNSNVGFVGDGINDSPSLAVADVGFSMGINGSQLSIEASDIVLVNDDPKKVASAIKISKFTRKIVWQNILFSAGIKLLFLTLGAIGITRMLEAVVADVGVTLLAILNSLRALKTKS